MKIVEKKINKLSPAEKRALKKALIYEKRKGKPIFYKNYKKVLAGELNVEAVMGSNALQWKILQIIIRYLFQNLDLSRYEIAFNEAGFLLEKGSWRNLDIAVFDKKKIEAEGFNNYYATTPPELVIEVDTKAETQELGGLDFYIRQKTQDLLDANAKKVIWFTTADKRVLIAEKNQDWLLSPWNKEISLLENFSMNLSVLIKKEGLEL